MYKEAYQYGGFKVFHSAKMPESMVAQWLAQWPMVLEILVSISSWGKENFSIQISFLSVICRDIDVNKQGCCPSDLDVNWMPPVQGVSQP